MQMDRRWVYKADRGIRSSLMACIIFWMWLRQISRMVSCAARAYSARIIKITPLGEPFIVIFSLIVSCPNTSVGPNMDKRVL